MTNKEAVLEVIENLPDNRRLPTTSAQLIVAVRQNNRRRPSFSKNPLEKCLLGTIILWRALQFYVYHCCRSRFRV